MNSLPPSPADALLPIGSVMTRSTTSSNAASSTNSTKSGRAVLGRRSLDSTVDEIKASRSRSGIHANRDDDNNNNNEEDDVEGKVFGGRRRPPLQRHPHPPHRRWNTFPQEGAPSTQHEGNYVPISNPATSDVELNSDEDRSETPLLDEVHHELTHSGITNVTDEAKQANDDGAYVTNKNGAENNSIEDVHSPMDAEEHGSKGEKRAEAKLVADLPPPPMPPACLLPFPPPQSFLSPIPTLAPPPSVPPSLNSSSESASETFSPNAQLFPPGSGSPMVGVSDGSHYHHQYAQQPFSPHPPLPSYGYGQHPIWNQPGAYTPFDPALMPPPPPAPAAAPPPPPPPFPSPSYPNASSEILNPVPAFPPPHGSSHPTPIPYGGGASLPPPPHSNLLSPDSLILTPTKLKPGTHPSLTPTSTTPMAIITPPQSPLSAINNIARRETKSSSSSTSSLNGDAPIFKPRVVQHGLTWPDVTKPPPASTGLTDADSSGMKGAYPGHKAVAPALANLSAAVANVIDDASLSSSSSSLNKSSIMRGLQLTDTQGRISFQVKSVSKISSSQPPNNGGGVDVWNALKRPDFKHHHQHHHKSQPGSYGGMGGSRPGARSMYLSRRENLDEFCHSTKMYDEPVDENFLDWIEQGGGSEQPFIDSHCHLDFLLDRSDYHDTFGHYMEDEKKFFPPNFGGCVTNFCNPETFYFKNAVTWLNRLRDSPVPVWQSWGCHPKKALLWTRETHVFLQDVATRSDVVSMGEIGLDYSLCPTDDVKAKQKKVFAEQCGLAVKAKKPLVIHCRDAQDDCLEVLKRYVPHEWKIHCHCFMEDWDDCLNKWLNNFPNLYIGLTNFRSANQQRVAMNIPLDRLLLETDAPYFVPRRLPKHSMISMSSPGMALFTAASIAHVKGKSVSITDVLKQTKNNTKIMYDLPR